MRKRVIDNQKKSKRGGDVSGIPPSVTPGETPKGPNVPAESVPCGHVHYFGYGSYTCDLPSGHEGVHRASGASWDRDAMFAHAPSAARLAAPPAVVGGDAQSEQHVSSETQPAESVSDWLLEVARQDGCEYPTFAESSDGAPVIVDTASGRTYRIKLEEF